MTDTPVRLLNLLSLLQTPREWPGSELAERLGVSPRTIRRDIERLRDLGYPVQATMGAVGGYRLAAGAAMPPLVLDDEEAVAIAVGLRAGAGHAVEGIEEASVRALAKLEQVLPSRLRHRVTALQAATVPLTWGDGATVDPRTLTIMAAATTGNERLRFSYRTAEGVETKRLVEPNRLVSTGRRWYLVAYDNDREDWRTFRVDRVSDPFPTGARFEPRELPAENAAEFVSGPTTRRQPELRMVVTLHAPVAAVAGRLPHWMGVPRPVDDETCRLDTECADSVEWVAIHLAMLGCEFEVHEPEKLIASTRLLGERITRAAGGPAGEERGRGAGVKRRTPAQGGRRRGPIYKDMPF